MELEELKRRLLAFARAKYDDPGVSVSRVHLMPGHAGFSYGFTVVTGTREESFFLRVATAQRQVARDGRRAASGSGSERARRDGYPSLLREVVWRDLEWFGCPYFIVPALEGDVPAPGSSPCGGPGSLPNVSPSLPEERGRSEGRVPPSSGNIRNDYRVRRFPSPEALPAAGSGRWATWNRNEPVVV